MQKIKSWHLFYLLRLQIGLNSIPKLSRPTPKVSFFKVLVVGIWCLIFGISTSLTAQNARGNYNFLDFQQKPYYFGITLGFNSADFRVFHSKTFILNDSIQTAQSVTGPGFNLGIVTNLKIGDYFDFRFLPTLSFSDRRLEYDFVETGKINKEQIEAVFVEAPFLVRYKSEPYKDLRVFVIAGVKYSFDVASNSRTRQKDSLIKISPNDFAV